MKRMITLFISLFITALVLAACGSNADPVVTGDTGGSDPTLAPDDDPGNGAADPTLAPDEPPLGAGPYPIATLDITITHPEAEEVRYTISCLGDTATVTGDVSLSERAACERLADPDVRTRLIEGVPTDQVCTEQYGGPDIAVIVGTYDGVDGVVVDTTVDRVNGCGISDWDSLLAGVLPPPVGITS
ncbi:MAG: hypothetical protein ACR2P0_11960 [Acidimicrobiales bacterium]